MPTPRFFDFVVAAIALVVLAPLLAALAVAVRLRLGSPVLFCQRRPGLHGEPFTLVKFRSMRDAHDEAGKPLPDDQRLPSFGRALRATSLDELPELWNVLRGDMALVGPRPLLMEYLPHYGPREALRHAVRPGITGWAQVQGRNAITWETRFRLDAWYVEHRSFLLDLRILAMTVIQVLRREGVTQHGEATVAPWTGRSSS